jgi:hypothetical protein
VEIKVNVKGFEGRANQAGQNKGDGTMEIHEIVSERIINEASAL